MTEKDKELINNYIKRIKKGDVESVENLHSLFSPRLYFIAIKYFKGEDVKDFVQDFWSNIQKICWGYRLVINGFNYLIKSAENLARNKYNKEKRIKRTEPVTLEDIKHYAYAETDIERIEQNELIETFFKQLPEIEIKIIFGLFFEEKTIRQVAKELDIPRATVGYKKLMALQKLKTYLTGLDKT